MHIKAYSLIKPYWALWVLAAPPLTKIHLELSQLPKKAWQILRGRKIPPANPGIDTAHLGVRRELYIPYGATMRRALKGRFQF